MDLMEAIKGRRAVRKYKPDPIPQEILDKVMDAAHWAPSWSNTQCWRWVLVRDKQKKEQLSEALRTSRPTGKNRAYEALKTADVAIVVCAQKGLAGHYNRGEKIGQPSTEKGECWYMFDTALAMQNLTLAAHAFGLATVHIGMYDPDKVAQIVGLPSDVAVVELMPLGWPDHSPEPTPRKDLSELVFYDSYKR